MTAADTLSRAATVLRQAAKQATRGPWRVGPEGSEGSYIAPDYGDLRTKCRFIGIANGRVQPEDGHNAAYMAMVSPDVGRRWADWLDAFTAFIEWQDERFPQSRELAGSDPKGLRASALAVARAILREGDEQP